jgi:hypothetical protein
MCQLVCDSPIGRRVDGLELTAGSHGRPDLDGRRFQGSSRHHSLDDVVDRTLQ